MQVKNQRDGELFLGEEGHTLTVLPSNRGEPYRAGVELTLSDPDYGDSRWVFLETHEGIRLRDALNRIFPDAR